MDKLRSLAMSSRSSSTSSISSGGFDTEVTTTQFEISNERLNIFEESDNETAKAENGNNVFVNERTSSTDEQNGYHVVNIEEISKYENVEIQSEDQVDSTSALRRRPGDPGAKRSSFKKQARLSRMLQKEDTSSSDDDDLYVLGSLQRRKPQIRSPLRDSDIPEYDLLPQAASPQNKTLEDVRNQERRESVPMHLLSKIVNPDVLNEVKAHLRQVERSQSRDLSMHEPSPAKLWELRKKQQNDKVLLNKTQAAKLKAGWRVRQFLNSLPDGDTVNTLYLTLVKRDMLREVEALFSLAKVSRSVQGFDKDYKDEDDKSALTIAIDNKNEAMLGKLIEHGVDLGISMFHVIDADFMPGLKLILMYNACTELCITKENHHFKIGMTPMLLAAHNNNYRMLSLLHEYGHRLTELKEWHTGIHVAWESANERRMICEARAQPAYITLISEVNKMNPMEYCLKEIKNTREYADKEREFSSYYKQNILKLEDYMCSLLDYICSSEELADLFQFEWWTPSENDDRLRVLVESAKVDREALLNRFKLLERANKTGLVRFVTHQQSQLALSYLRYRSLPYLRHDFLTALAGCFFPILSIIHVVIPNTFLGSIITLPTVSFSCHVASDVAFALFLMLNISLKDVTVDCIGAKPTALEILLVLWILGKWLQELQECSNRGMKDYFRDYWNYIDLVMLALFTASIVIRIFDIFYNMDNTSGDRCQRYKWEYFEPRLIAEGIQAWAYVFVFIRMLGIMRVDRRLGPLQISLSKMLVDIVHFFTFFVLMICAFAFGLSDLYWYYGTKPGSRMLCNKNLTDINKTRTCTTGIPFNNMGFSIVNLFWALFGFFDLKDMHLLGKHYYTEVVGKTLLATYHVVAIIVMLNMLIAMMSKSYDDTSVNEETSWKFHRTSMWIRYIRREVVRPSPMNLLPNPWKIKESLYWLKNSFQRRRRKKNVTNNSALENIKSRQRSIYRKTGSASASVKRSHSNRQVRSVLTTLRRQDNAGFSFAIMMNAKNAIRKHFRASKTKKVVGNLVQRYKLKHLVVAGKCNNTLEIA